MSNDKKIKTHFKGPGEWRSQAAELEKEAETPAEDQQEPVEE